MTDKETEKILIMIFRAQAWIQIGSRRIKPRLYFLPRAPGTLIITETRVIFLSKYELKRGIKFIPIKAHLGEAEIQVDIPISTILEYPSRRKKYSGKYIIDKSRANQFLKKHVVTFFCKAQDFFLKPQSFATHNAGITDAFKIIKSQEELREAFDKWTDNYEVMIHLANLKDKTTRRKVATLIQKLREKSAPTGARMYLHVT